MSDSAESVRKHVRSYLFIGAALIVLTGLTVGISYVDFGHRTLNIVVALVIATLKAGLVAAIFMHLFWDMFVKMAVIFKVMIFTAVFFAGLMALTVWTLKDEIGHSTYPGPMFRQSAPAAEGEHPAH